jgi:hypothetical protein
MNGLVFRECIHIKNIFEDVYFTKNLFHITLIDIRLLQKMLRFFKVEDRTLKRHIFVVYIDTGSSAPRVPSKSRDLADENNKILTEWK